MFLYSHCYTLKLFDLEIVNIPLKICSIQL